VQEGQGKERIRAEGINTREEERQEGGNKRQEKGEKKCRGNSQARKGNSGGRRVRRQTEDMGDEGGRTRRGMLRRVGEGSVDCNGRTRATGGGEMVKL